MSTTPQVIPIPANTAAFRADFPEFASKTMFPDSSVNFWLVAAGMLLNAQRWGGTIGLAIELFTAHNLALEAYAQGAANKGAIPGLNMGALSSESGDKLSVSYDTGATTIAGGAHWNMTTFGTRFLFLARLFGAGPIQVGPGGFGCGYVFLPWSGSAYCGPGWFVST